MWQDITVCIIGLFVALYVGRHKSSAGVDVRGVNTKAKSNNFFPISQGFVIFANHPKKHEQ